MPETKNNHIIIYIIIIIFCIGFIFYFYKQSSTGILEVEDVEIRRPPVETIKGNYSINLDLFKDEKFKRLKETVFSASKFSAGKKNPFEPY